MAKWCVYHIAPDGRATGDLIVEGVPNDKQVTLDMLEAAGYRFEGRTLIKDCRDRTLPSGLVRPYYEDDETECTWWDLLEQWAKQEGEDITTNTYRTEVAGVTFENRQKAVGRLTKGDKVFLVREPDNSHDSNAIRVEHPSNGQIGYIPRDLARQIASQLDAVGSVVEATVVGLTGGTADYQNRGAEIVFSIPVQETELAGDASLLKPFGRIRMAKYPSVSVAAISGDDKLLVIVHHGENNQFEVWQCSPLKQLSNVRHQGTYNHSVSLAVSYSGNKVAILDRDDDGASTKVQVWNPRSGELLATLDGPKTRSRPSSIERCEMCFSRLDDFLMVGCIERQKVDDWYRPTDIHEYLVAGWRTDTWQKVIDSRKTMPPKGDHPLVAGSASNHPQDSPYYTSYLLLLEPDKKTVLFQVVTDPSGDRSTLQWLDTLSMSICKQIEVPDKIDRVISAGRSLIAALSGTSAYVIDTDGTVIVDKFIPPHGDVHAIFADFKLLLYHTFYGDDHVDLSILHAHEYGGGSRSLVAGYLEKRIDWRVACSSSSGHVFVVKEYGGWNKRDDYFAVFGYQGIMPRRTGIAVQTLVHDLGHIVSDQEAPIISEPIYLRDVSDEYRDLEGDNCPYDKRAWVVVRKATQADREHHAALLSGYTLKELWEHNIDVALRILDTEIYWCLYEAGNIVDENGSPAFRFKTVKGYEKLDMTFEDFRRLYRHLDRRLVYAIGAAVRKCNPEWRLSLSDLLSVV